MFIHRKIGKRVIALGVIIGMLSQSISVYARDFTREEYEDTHCWFFKSEGYYYLIAKDNLNNKTSKIKTDVSIGQATADVSQRVGISSNSVGGNPLNVVGRETSTNTISDSRIYEDGSLGGYYDIKLNYRMTQPAHTEVRWYADKKGNTDNVCGITHLTCENNKSSDGTFTCETWVNSNLFGCTDLAGKGYQHGEIYVAFNPCKERLVIDPDGGTYKGSTSASSYIKKCEETIKIDVPSRIGYVFDGWEITRSSNSYGVYGKYDSAKKTYTFEGPWSDIDNPTGNVDTSRLSTTTMTAKWHKCEYDIRFNKNEPTEIRNEVTGSMSNQHFKYGEFKNLTAMNFYRIGWHINEWNTRSNGYGTSYADEEQVGNLTTTNGDIIDLYAQWEVNHYYFKYNNNQPSKASDTVTDTVPTSTFTYDKVGWLSISEPKLVGWTFLNWNENTSGTSKDWYGGDEIFNYTTVDKYTKNIYAQWKQNKYKVNFDGNQPIGSINSTHASSANVVGDTPSQQFIYEEYQNLNASGYSLDGWTFAGWTREQNGHTYKDVHYTDKQRVRNITRDFSIETANTDGVEVTLYAQWRANQYYIDFDSNKPEKASSIVYNSMNSQMVMYDYHDKINKNLFVINGWHFVEWNTEADGSGKSFTDENDVYNWFKEDGARITLYAQWEQNKYTVHYNPNRPLGTINATHKASNEVLGSMDITHHVYDDASNLGLNQFSLVGWKFKGWTREAEGNDYTKVQYTDGQEVKTLTLDYGVDIANTDNSQVELYAQWKANDYTVKYDSDGGKGTMTDVVHRYDEVKELSQNTFTYSDDNFRNLTYNKYGVQYNHTYDSDYVGEFMKWSRDKRQYDKGDHEYYEDCERVVNLAGSENDGTDIVTMYACWNMLPNITIKTEDTHLLFYEGANITYKDLLKKVKAWDKEDRDLTSEISVYKIEYVNGDIDDNVLRLNTSAEHIGEYHITYMVQDHTSPTIVYETFVGEILYNNIPDVSTNCPDRFMYRQDIGDLSRKDFEKELGRLVDTKDIEDTGIDNANPSNPDDEKYWGDVDRKLYVENMEQIYDDIIKGASQVVIKFIYYDSYGKPNTSKSGTFTLTIVDRDTDTVIEDNQLNRRFVRFVSKEFIDTLEDRSIWRTSKKDILDSALSKSAEEVFNSFVVTHKPLENK